MFFWFSRYVNSAEKKVGKFFRWVHSGSNVLALRRRLLELMQWDLVTLSVVVEKEFKGYRYLKSKSRRCQLYDNREFLVRDFEKFLGKKEYGRKEYIEKIMEYLRLGERYFYLKTSTWGNLLRNPVDADLEGDCNQVVTLYIYLYSLRFPITDLKLKLLPGHICLHFNGRDIEATTGRYENYQDYLMVLDVEEIVVVNILDLHDFREEVVDLEAIDMVRAAEFCNKLGSLREVTEKNLRVAYNNIAISFAKKFEFKRAIYFAKKTGDRRLMSVVYVQAVKYFVDKNDYERAYRFMKMGGERDLEKFVYGSHYNYLLKKIRKKGLGVGERKLLLTKMADLLMKLGKFEQARELRKQLK